ncbi:MAG TPA: hypothetical protein VFA05_08245 [Gaiellaceae bacterium]|nr:hypothetical protein [Gaiellaceae bacterium]
MHGHHHRRRCGGGRHGLRFDRHGFPAREELVERLQAYRERLERELANVSDVIDRLGGAAAPPEGTAEV